MLWLVTGLSVVGVFDVLVLAVIQVKKVKTEAEKKVLQKMCFGFDPPFFWSMSKYDLIFSVGFPNLVKRGSSQSASLTLF